MMGIILNENKIDINRHRVVFQNSVPITNGFYPILAYYATTESMQTLSAQIL